MLRIAPKIAIDRLLYLLSHAQGRRLRWQSHSIDASVRHELLPAIATFFVRAAERALRTGPLFGYTGREETAMMLRGRFRAAAQFRRRPGLALPLEIAYEEHTPDIPENQLLRGAARRLARLTGIQPGPRAQLRRIDAQLEGVAAPLPGVAVPSWVPNRLNRHYVDALRLAEIILRGSSFEYEGQRHAGVDGLLFNMEKIFEDFIASSLGAAIERHIGGSSQSHPRTHHLDDAGEHVLLPDLVHRLSAADGRLHPVIVVDAKYQQGVRRENLYQMLAYCTCFGLAEGHLVSASGEADSDPLRVAVPGGAIMLHRHVLDLSQPSSELSASVDGIARSIIAARSSAPRPRAGAVA
ncbi:McrBC 5-methylcytosine restriction system component [Streptomyces sedi]